MKIQANSINTNLPRAIELWRREDLDSLNVKISVEKKELSLTLSPHLIVQVKELKTRQRLTERVLNLMKKCLKKQVQQ